MKSNVRAISRKDSATSDSSTDQAAIPTNSPVSPKYYEKTDGSPGSALRLEPMTLDSSQTTEEGNENDDSRLTGLSRDLLRRRDYDEVAMFKKTAPLAPPGFVERLVTLTNIIEDLFKKGEKTIRDDNTAKQDMIAALRVMTAKDNTLSTFDILATFDILSIYVSNLIQYPKYAIFRQIRVTNRNFDRLVHKMPGATDFLIACGYEAIRDPDDAESMLVMTEKALNMSILESAQSMLKKAMHKQTGTDVDEESKYTPVLLSEEINRNQFGNHQSTLPKTVVEEDTVDYLAGSKRFRVGVSDTIGHRPTMEDRMVIYGQFCGLEDEDYFALFDGHGGSDVSDFASANLHGAFAHRLDDTGQDVQKAFEYSFNDVNVEIKKAGLYGGTTVVVIYADGSSVHIANAGDSRCVLARHGEGDEKWEAHRLTVDHKPDLPEEEERIENAGGYVSCMNGGVARVNGSLAVSRSLGDHQLQPCVSAEPYIRCNAIDLGDDANEFLIMACDGFFDVMDDLEAVEEAAPLIHRSADDAALYLRNLAYKKGSTDNISVMCIAFGSGVDILGSENSEVGDSGGEGD